LPDGPSRANVVRDLLARRQAEHAVISVSPDDALSIPYSRMKLYDVSQLAVLRADKTVGIIDESDVLVAVFCRAENFKKPVAR